MLASKAKWSERSPERRAFVHYLRTGWELPPSAFMPSPRPQQKFNPYHDPHNGQFTTGPGGGSTADASGNSAGGTIDSPPVDVHLDDGVFRPETAQATVVPAQFMRPPGGNARAFEDPMTLEQVFPGHADSPAGSIVAVADDFLDLTGPGTRLTAELTKLRSQALIDEIRSVDPSYRFESLGFPGTLEGQMNQLNGLRFDRARAYYAINGDIRPLQVETLRFLQRETDSAYASGVELLRAGKLGHRLSPNEALGSYVDRSVRQQLRRQFNMLGILTSRGEAIRVNSREYDSSVSERTYRIPDSRIGDTAFDVTLSRKRPLDPQIRGFFASDFKPNSVVIVRPTQLGPNGTYVIRRPGG